MPEVVSNSTPLIALSRLHKLDLLKHYFGNVLIPREVYTEVVTRGGTLYGADEVSHASWISVIDVSNRTAVDALCLTLDPGEAEAIVLARERNALLIIDDKDGRNTASSLSISFTGTIGLLLLAAQDELIDFKKEFDELISFGFRIIDTEYCRIINLVHQQ